jgi:hypothetical protein
MAATAAVTHRRGKEEVDEEKCDMPHSGQNSSKFLTCTWAVHFSQNGCPWADNIKWECPLRGRKVCGVWFSENGKSVPQEHPRDEFTCTGCREASNLATRLVQLYWTMEDIQSSMNALEEDSD